MKIDSISSRPIPERVPAHGAQRAAVATAPAKAVGDKPSMLALQLAGRHTGGDRRGLPALDNDESIYLSQLFAARDGVSPGYDAQRHHPRPAASAGGHLDVEA